MEHSFGHANNDGTDSFIADWEYDWRRNNTGDYSEWLYEFANTHNNSGCWKCELLNLRYILVGLDIIKKAREKGE